MTELIIEIYKNRIELLKEVYLDKIKMINEMDLDLSFESISKLIPVQTDYDRYSYLFDNKIDNEEFLHLKDKLTKWKILNSINDFDNNSLGDVIKRIYNLEKKKRQEKNTTYYLFFDTETTGLPKNWEAPISDFNNWPRLVQLAYILFDEEGNVIEEDSFIINPEGFIIPIEASRVHGITTDRAISEGVSLEYVLDAFQKLIKKSEYLIAHNIAFDEKIIDAEFLRNEYHNLISSKKKICTMEKTTNFCAINGPYGYKWPKLSELHYKLFKYNFEEAHDASVDIKVTAKCFWELRNRNII